MKRLVVVAATFSLLVAACAPSTSESTEGTSSPSSSTIQQDTSTTGAGSSGSTAPDSTNAPDTSRPPLEGPVAPNFTLALATGEDFVLADAAKPVYMVFWAEW